MGDTPVTNIAEQLTRDEGCVLTVYACPTGHLTIGVGRNLEATGITQDEAELLLDNDIARVTREIDQALPWTRQLDDVRFGVVQNLTFNMGITGVLEFERMLAAMEAGDWEAAADELLDSEYATQVGDRAERLALQLRTGQWQ
jgi:lysozyme